MNSGNKLILSILVTGILIFSPLAVAEATLPSDLPEVSKAPFKTQIIKHGNYIAKLKPLYTTFNDPINYETPLGEFSGVAKLYLTLNTKPVSIDVGCSGTLISDFHILTAAHCVTNDKNGKLILKEGFAIFEKDSISIPLLPSKSIVHPDWNYDLVEGNDVAILTLASPAPVELTRYGIDNNGADDVGATIYDKTGYGWSGNGDEGAVLPFGTKRDGYNQYDATHDLMWKQLGQPGYVPGAVIQYDFDNGSPANDAFGTFFGISNTGLGESEVNSAPGDSGGPTINANGEITGITSYGLRLQFTNGVSSDVDDEVNSTFGEFSGDTRVSAYYTFINSILDGTSNDGSDDSGTGSGGACPPAKQAKGKC